MAKPPPVIVVVCVLVGLAQAHLGEWDPSLRRNVASQHFQRRAPQVDGDRARSGQLPEVTTTQKAQRSHDERPLGLRSQVRTGLPQQAVDDIIILWLTAQILKGHSVPPLDGQIVVAERQTDLLGSCGAQGRLADSGHTNEDNVWAYPISYARHALSVRSGSLRSCASQ